MKKEIIEKWEANKHLLEKYFKETEQEEYLSYETIFKKVIELCLNTSDNSWETYNLNAVTVIDDGDYQGTQIFIIPKNTYQPSFEDYLITNTYYGSCSGCDTLQGISSYDYGLPSEEQVKDYMMLSLHLVQKMKYLND